MISDNIIISDPHKICKCGLDWNKAHYGRKLEHLGIRCYWDSGDAKKFIKRGAWLSMTGNSSEDVDKIINWSEDEVEKYLEKLNVLGTFMSSSGILGVYSLSDINIYNPNYKEHYSLIIPEFTGIISSITRGSGIDKEIWLLGKGNINFFARI